MYLDPGYGGMLNQMLIALVIVGAVIAIIVLWKRNRTLKNKTNEHADKAADSANISNPKDNGKPD